MNGAGIDDAEGARARALTRECISKNLPARRASAVGEKSLMDHSFLFGAVVLFLAYPRDAEVVYRLYSRIKNLCSPMEFRIVPLVAQQEVYK